MRCTSSNHDYTGLYGFQTRPFAEVITWRLFDFRFAFFHILCFNCRYPYESKSEPIKVFQLYPDALAPLIQGLMASGFTLLPANPPVPRLFLPCPVGTFSNSSNQGTEGCTPCPAGIRLLYICYSPAGKITKKLFTCLGRSVLGESVPEVLRLRLRAQFLPIRTDLGTSITFSFFPTEIQKFQENFPSLSNQCVLK